MCTHNQCFEQTFKISNFFHFLQLKKFLYIAWASFHNEQVEATSCKIDMPSHKRFSILLLC